MVSSSLFPLWLISLLIFSRHWSSSRFNSKETKITRQDLTTTFSIQQALCPSPSCSSFLFTPLIQRSYGMDQQAVYLLWALGISLFLSSLKTIPSILLRKKP